jgi:hypothetical protein
MYPEISSLSSRVFVEFSSMFLDYKHSLHIGKYILNFKIVNKYEGNNMRDRVRSHIASFAPSVISI